MNGNQLGGKEIIGILGAGSWGATLAALLGQHGKRVHLWSRDSEKVRHLQHNRRLERPIEVALPDPVTVFADLDECLADVELVLLCCTAQSMREVAGRAATALAGRMRAAMDRAGDPPIVTPILVSAAKGLELGTFKRMSQVICDITYESLPALPVCALSGPNLAREVLSGLPTASVIACAEEDIARAAQHMLSVPSFRIYTNTDVTGVELGGALKNIIAIAAGAVDGLHLGTNAKAALMTRGLAEMARIARALGAQPATMSGLSGMGDLVCTCDSPLSRNYSLGFDMAQGVSFTEAQMKSGAVVEGVTTTFAVVELSKKLGIQVPIAEQVAATLNGESTLEKAIMALMARPLASE